MSIVKEIKMYFCSDCGLELTNVKRCIETHGLDTSPYEKIIYCPFCKSSEVYEKTTLHCKCCGIKLNSDKKDYCSPECAKKGKKLWELQAKKQMLYFSNPINTIVREVISYNKEHKTNYSYGQYVALVKYSKKRKKR